MAKKIFHKEASGSNLFTIWVTVVGIAIAYGAIHLARVYNERQARNEQLRQYCGAATAAVEKCRADYAALCSKEGWAEISPLASEEKWAQALVASASRIKEARGGVCKDGSKDLEGCQLVTDNVKEEMSGLSDHLHDVLAVFGDRAGTERNLHEEMSEGRALLKQAERLLSEAPSRQGGDDRALVSKIRNDLNGVKTGSGLLFSDLYNSYRVATRSTERLHWLVDRLSGDKKVVDDEWRVNVVNSFPAYMATFARYTWDNNRDNPTISSSEMTTEVSKGIFETIRSANGTKIANTRPGGMLNSRFGYEVEDAVGLSRLVDAPYPLSDNEGEIDLEDCSEAIKTTLQFKFKGQSVERTVSIYKEDLGMLFPLTAGQSFVLKAKNASTDQVKIPVWLAPTWSQVYNQGNKQTKGGI